jgi:putative hydrolase of the HAD superfamily
MILKADSDSYFVFDLDDTLYSEIDFLKSAYKSITYEIAPGIHEQLFKVMIELFESGGNPFDYLIERFPEKKITKEKLLYLYRKHYPDISLREGVLEVLLRIKKKNGSVGIITDGRSVTQRNKIKALGIEKYIDKAVISEEFGFEKPEPSVFKIFMEEGNGKKYYYFGDNISKDFIAPRKLGWYCIGVSDKDNIRKQNLSDFSEAFLPHSFINSFTEIEII